MNDGHDDHQTATVARAVPTTAAAPSSSFEVVVVSGPDAGQRFSLDAADSTRVLVGQGPACFIKLTDREVSRRHAALEVAGSRLRVTDLGSTNGTYIGALAIVEALVTGGEPIRVGQTTLVVEPVAPARTSKSAAPFRFGRMVGGSEEMRRIYPLCAKLAASNIPATIEGETGTGKEVLAEALHEASPRAGGPFIVFDCTAVAPSLMESALFGHEKGSFTGATATRRGVFEQAHGGTLLIDEIGELEPQLQPKLLRAIQRGEIQRVGGDRWLKVDVRILAATRRDLDREVQEGRFRDDLFYRLAVARVELPALRKRRGDVSLLTSHFWAQLGGGPEGPSPELLARFERYDWPGNVRELHNAVARTIALGELAGDVTAGSSTPVAEEDGSISVSIPISSGDTIEEILALDLRFPHARDRVMEDFERRYVERVLAKHGGNVARAAAASGIARRYFQLIRARSLPTAAK